MYIISDHFDVCLQTIFVDVILRCADVIVMDSSRPLSGDSSEESLSSESVAFGDRFPDDVFNGETRGHCGSIKDIICLT